MIQEPGSNAFTGLYWNPPQPYQFKSPPPVIKGGLRIYETHIGMAQEGGKVGSFDEFREKILPRRSASGEGLCRRRRAVLEDAQIRIDRGRARRGQN